MGNKPAGCNSQQPIQALLEDAISALRERPGSTQSDIIKYLESKYDRSIPTVEEEEEQHKDWAKEKEVILLLPLILVGEDAEAQNLKQIIEETNQGVVSQELHLHDPRN
jgi:flagellar motility protein MotE (MotC chaperone)